ncbi:hypothetical protein SteCoe_29164 [Stentor coeruleus]|uniref:VWFA domain-containing protein n=1 Tax=Stentor coeruleus TaxID=5963 RepID=A0A1R2B6K6_9CILI|nr:hypothetical protein SteCoe_29164 [Stentor coeruleus]
MALSAATTGLLMAELGYEPVEKNTIMQKLNLLKPSGGTALRDSVGFGVSLILKLNQALSEIGTSEIWNFVHIVITDGDDTSSKTKPEELAALFYLINQTIPTSRCSTSYVGIELSQKAAAELTLISVFGGNSCNAYQANNVNLNQIFDRISIDVGIVRQVGVVGVNSGNQSALMIHQRSAPVVQVKRNRFAVLLNLDFSGSMRGQRWNSLKNSVSMFLRNLQQGDLACCCLFNDKVQMLNRLQISQPKPAITYSQPSSNASMQISQPKPAITYSQPSSNASSNNYSSSVPKKKEKSCCVIF